MDVFKLLVLSFFAVLLLTILRSSIFGAVEPEKHVYFEIVFLLLLAVAGELAVSYLKLPSVMILMVLGIMLSRSFLDQSWTVVGTLGLPLPAEPPEILRLDEVIHVFAQLGAVVLLFKIGLHNKISSIL